MAAITRGAVLRAMRIYDKDPDDFHRRFGGRAAKKYWVLQYWASDDTRQFGRLGAYPSRAIASAAHQLRHDRGPATLQETIPCLQALGFDIFNEASGRVLPSTIPRRHEIWL